MPAAFFPPAIVIVAWFLPILAEISEADGDRLLQQGKLSEIQSLNNAWIVM